MGLCSVWPIKYARMCGGELNWMDTQIVESVSYYSTPDISYPSLSLSHITDLMWITPDTGDSVVSPLTGNSERGRCRLIERDRERNEGLYKWVKDII